MDLEHSFINDSCRYAGQRELDKVMDFVRTFEYRPDQADALLAILRRDNYNAKKLIEKALEAGNFPDNCW